jgi:galactose oxidase-like protein/Kelch motif protein
MPITPYAWTATKTSPLGTSTYFDHTATLLQDGRVLVAGGSGTAGTTTVLYDPNTDTWTPTSGSLSMVRDANSMATLLPSGKVLLVGGSGATTGELYDPATDAWTLTSVLKVPRTNHTATLLLDGRVLVAGGFPYAASNTVELYDPTTDTWTLANSLGSGRWDHTATRLQNGKVLVAGGSGSGATTGELYDPTTDTWTSSQLNLPRVGHTATLLLNGKVLVTGGTTAATACELYNPATGTWTGTGNMGTARMYHTATLTPNGNVLVAGGGSPSNEIATTEVFNPLPLGGIWTVAVPSLSTPRLNHTATLFSNNMVLVVGGTGSSGTISAGTSAEYALLPVTVTFLQTSSGYTIRNLVSCTVNGQYQYQRLTDAPYIAGYGRSVLVPASATSMRVLTEGKALGLSMPYATVFDKTYPTAGGKTFTFGDTADSTAYNITYTEQAL